MPKKIESQSESVEEFPLPPKKGEIVEGTITAMGPACVYVDLSPIGMGIILGKEYYLAKKTLGKSFDAGEKISAKVIEVDNENGFIELSLKEAQKEIGWEKLKELKENFETVSIRPNGANRGGLLAEYSGVKGFLPLSQLSVEHYPRIEEGDASQILAHLQQFVGKEMEVKILDLDPQESKLIFSEKAVESKTIQHLLKNYKVGDKIEGKITGVADFGAFIKFAIGKKDKNNELANIEGLIHISELDWQLIHDPLEVVKIGETVKAQIVDITKEGRVSLSLKALKKDPWIGIEKKFKSGDIVKGKVVKINQFGAFIEIAPKIRGLIHAFDIKESKKKIKEGESYQFKITHLDPKEHRLALKF